LMNFSQRSLRGAEIWHIWQQHHVIECFWKIMRQVSYPREQFFKFMFLPSKVEVQYQPKKRRHCPP
jgi:hypothetical protein